MWKLLDRQMFFNYLKSYLVCLVSLLGLFIVVDLFTNLDDFSSATDDLPTLIEYVSTYYLYNSVKIFDRLSEAIVLLAAMFTIALMQRNNELLPLLSAGVSTRRVVRPVLLGAVVMLGLSAANQEMILPRVDGSFVEIRGDPTGEKESEVNGAYDTNGMQVSGRVAIKKDMIVKDFVVVFPPKVGRESITALQAKEARYIPPGGEGQSGGWMLTTTKPEELDGWSRRDLLECIVPGQYFLRTDLDFEKVTRLKNWHIYTPTWRLLEELNRLENNKLASVAVMFHMRLTRPILGMVLVFLGLSVILRDQNRNVFISAGMCLILCGFFFVACFTCQSMGNNEYLSPALAAWLPVLLFGPLSFVMFDAVHT
jgi:lipopolysaccharide export system permease protein